MKRSCVGRVSEVRVRVRFTVRVRLASVIVFNFSVFAKLVSIRDVLEILILVSF